MSILPASPFIVIVCLVLIGISSGWVYSLITLLVWVICIAIQLCINTYQRKMKAAEAKLSDTRMKLVNDLVSGIRTIKSYAWENHCLSQIKKTRAAQYKELLKF